MWPRLSACLCRKQEIVTYGRGQKKEGSEPHRALNSQREMQNFCFTWTLLCRNGYYWEGSGILNSPFATPHRTLTSGWWCQMFCLGPHRHKGTQPDWTDFLESLFLWRKWHRNGPPEPQIGIYSNPSCWQLNTWLSEDKSANSDWASLIPVWNY